MANAPAGALHPAAGDRGLPRREGRRDLDRQPGRAALGAAADGQQRPPRRRAALRRHGRLLGDAGARQRARGERDDRPHLRDRRHRDHRQGRADPRLRPRLAGGAQADAQPDQAALRDAGPRRPQAPAAARRAGRSRSASTRRTSSAAATACRSKSTRTAPASARTSTPARCTSTASTSATPTTPPCATAARSPPTASSSSSSTISTDDGSVVADPEVIFRGVAFLEEADAMVEELSDLIEDRSRRRPRRARREPPDRGGPARRGRQVRLPAAEAAADDLAGGHRGLTPWPTASARSEGEGLRARAAGSVLEPPHRAPRSRSARCRATGRPGGREAEGSRRLPVRRALETSGAYRDVPIGARSRPLGRERYPATRERSTPTSRASSAGKSPPGGVWGEPRRACVSSAGKSRAGALKRL